MKNTGKPSQTLFESRLTQRYGKRCFVHRVTDAAEVTGMNSRSSGRTKVVIVKEQPSDFIVTVEGTTFYAEVKSTTGGRWSRSKIEPGQFKAMTRQVAAGGPYWIYIHFITEDKWGFISGREFLESTKKSWSYDDLDDWNLY